MRDVLHVDDLLRAYEAAIRSPDKVAQQAFNVGGGPGQVLSLLDLVEMLEKRLASQIPLRWDDWRPGDQQVYVSDIRKLETVLGWKPEIGVAAGIAQLIVWVKRMAMSCRRSVERPQSPAVCDKDWLQPVVSAGLSGIAHEPALGKDGMTEQKSILVTGAPDFSARTFASVCWADGHDVICVDNFFTGQKQNIEHLIGHPRFRAGAP